MFILNNISRPAKQQTHAEQFPATGTQCPAIFDMDETQLRNKSGTNNKMNEAWMELRKGSLICVINRDRRMSEVQIVDEICNHEPTNTSILRARAVAKFKSVKLYPKTLEYFSVNHRHITKDYFFNTGANIVNLEGQLCTAEIELGEAYRNLQHLNEQPLTIGKLEKLLENQFNLADVWQEEAELQAAYWEGGRTSVYVNKYERNPKARQLCIEHYGSDCFICKQNMASIYGDTASGLVHVHHVTPLADMGEEYQVDPVRDLVPICPNCHAVIHRKNPPYTVKEVAEMYQVNSAFRSFSPPTN